MDFLYGFVPFCFSIDSGHWESQSKNQKKNRKKLRMPLKMTKKFAEGTYFGAARIEVLIEVNWKVDTRSAHVECRPVSPMSKWQHKSIVRNNTNLCSSFVLHRCRRRRPAQSSCDRPCAFARFHHIFFFFIIFFRPCFRAAHTQNRTNRSRCSCIYIHKTHKLSAISRFVRKRVISF